jgi:hypothetical protein
MILHFSFASCNTIYHMGSRQGLSCTRFFFPLYHKVQFQIAVASAKMFLEKLSKMLSFVELGANCQTLRELCETSLPIRISIAIHHILFIVWTIVKEPTYHEDSAHHMR